MKLICFDILDNGVKEYNQARSQGLFTLSCKVRLILLQESQVCLVHSVGEGYWTFPGGGIERGETPEQAACREAREEVGAELGELVPVAQIREFRHKTRVLQITDFFVSHVQRLGPQQLTEEEKKLGTEVEWISKAKVGARLGGMEDQRYHRRFSSLRDRELWRRLDCLSLGHGGLSNRYSS